MVAKLSLKHNFYPSRATRRTFAKRFILKGLKARPSTGFLNVETIDDVVKNYSDSLPTTKLRLCIYTALKCNPKLQHLYYLKNPVSGRPSCTEMCDTGKLCNKIAEFNRTCSHPKGHSIMTPHECYACDALRESKEKYHRGDTRKKREAIKRKAEPIEHTPKERETAWTCGECGTNNHRHEIIGSNTCKRMRDLQVMRT
jgi:hypothetical protein